MEGTGKVTARPNDDSRNPGRNVNQASTGAHDVMDKMPDVPRRAMDPVAAGRYQAIDEIAAAAGHAAELPGMDGEQSGYAQMRATADCLSAYAPGRRCIW